MSKDVIEIEGTIIESMPNAMFRVYYITKHPACVAAGCLFTIYLYITDLKYLKYDIESYLLHIRFIRKFQKLLSLFRSHKSTDQSLHIYMKTGMGLN